MSKIKLIESFNIDFSKDKLKENVEILEKPKLVEGNNHKQFEARAIIRDIPTSRYIPNQNNRIYNESLWRNVAKSGRAEGSDCYGNHAVDDDGNVFDSVGVWHNLRITDNYPIADLYCIGEGGQLLAEKAKAGGKVGFSTVGYGEFLEDNMTVNPDTYELSHLADWVVNPSQEVYATIENMQEKDCKTEETEDGEETKDNEEKDKKIEENNVKNTENVQENKESNESSNETFTNKLIEEVENSNVENQNKIKNEVIMDKLQEANIKNQLNAVISAAKKNQNISEAIESVKSFDVAGIDYLIEKQNKAVDELEAKLEEKRQNAEKELEEKNKKFDELQKKLESNENEMKELKSNYDKVSSMLEKMIKEQNVEDQSVSFSDTDINNKGRENYKDVEAQNVTFKQTDSDPNGMDITTTPPNEVVEDHGDNADTISNQSDVMENVKKFNTNVKTLKEQKKLMEKELSQLKEDRENMKSDIKALLEDRKTMISDIKKLTEERKTMLSDIKKLVKKYKEMKKKFKEQEDEEKKDDEDKEEMEEEYSENEPYEFSFVDNDETLGDNTEDKAVTGIEEEGNMTPDDSYIPEQETEEDEFEMDYNEMEPEVEEQINTAENEMNSMPMEEPEMEEEGDWGENDSLKTGEEEEEEEFDFNEEDMNFEEQDDLEDEYEEKPVMEKKNDKKTPIRENKVKTNPIKEQVKEYFEAEVKINSALKDVKEKIMESKTLSEAVMKVNKFKESLKKKDNEEAPIKFTESTGRKPGWLEGRY